MFAMVITLPWQTKSLLQFHLNSVPDACFVVKQEHVLIRISFNRQMGWQRVCQHQQNKTSICHWKRERACGRFESYSFRVTHSPILKLHVKQESQNILNRKTDINFKAFFFLIHCYTTSFESSKSKYTQVKCVIEVREMYAVKITWN